MSWFEKAKALLDNKENELIIQIEQTLRSLGIRKPEYCLATAIEEYVYLRTAVLLAVTNEEFQKELTKTFYTTIAKTYVSNGYLATTKMVEKGISAQIEAAWYLRNENTAEAWKTYFGISLEESEIKPTNFEFILTLATALRSKINQISMIE